MILEEQSPGELGYDKVKYNLSESYIADRRSSDFDVKLDDLVLLYGERRGGHARRSIGEYIDLYNRNRPHSSLKDQTPDEAYFATLPAIKSAA
nr:MULTISPECIES: integrase core domain-containing protein [unclassified Burkholderia]